MSIQNGLFSLKSLMETNAPLGKQFIWQANEFPSEYLNYGKVKLHLGCGDNIIPGFINMDFTPINDTVVRWEILNPWPEILTESVEMIFSEDVFEHFFWGDQLYFLCSVNCSLIENGVFRILMPNLDRILYAFRLNNEATLGVDWLTKTFNIRTLGDAINLALRMGGHRWIHNQKSIVHLAQLAGFEVIPTTCETSTVSDLNHLNLRNEDNSLSFANDLVKQRHLKRINVIPNAIINATLIEQVSDSVTLYRADGPSAHIFYVLPIPVSVENVSMINFRGSNISQFNEHNYAKVLLGPHEDFAVYIDSSLRSCNHLNVISSLQLKNKLPLDYVIKILCFYPSQTDGDYFLVGPCELFVFE